MSSAPAPDVASYERLFASQTLALLATGLATVALSLLAFELAGEEAGAVLGTALAVKMLVNVTIGPIVASLVVGLPRRPLLTVLSLTRITTLLALPFVSAAWHIWLLIAAFQVGAAVAAAVYIATVGEMMPADDDFARAVAKSRIAYEAETLLSPLLAAALLAVMSSREVFVVSAAMLALAILALSTAQLPPGKPAAAGPFALLGQGFRPLFADRALRAALVVSAAGITVSAMVLVNTVTLVRGVFALDGAFVGLTLAAYGAGSIVAALALPRLLQRTSEVAVVTRSASGMAVLLLLGPLVTSLSALLALWAAIGVASTLTQVPVKLIVGRLQPKGGRQAVHAAHYALDHAVLLFAYPAAGWLATTAGLDYTLFSLAALTGLLVLTAASVWPGATTAGHPR